MSTFKDRILFLIEIGFQFTIELGSDEKSYLEGKMTDEEYIRIVMNKRKIELCRLVHQLNE